LPVTVSDIHQELIERGVDGDRKALSELYKLYSRAMFNVAVRILNSREDAEEALQDAFTEAFMKLNTFRYESTFGSWLKRIVINRSINLALKRKMPLTGEEELKNIPADEANDRDNEKIQYEVSRILKAMEELPHGFRIVFSLYMIEGYDHEEIAGILNISESTSKSQLHRAKAKIKEIILNREAFDIHEAPDNSWEKIEKRLQGKRRINSLKTWMQRAAAVLLIFALSFGLSEYIHRKGPTTMSLASSNEQAALPQEIKETQAYYETRIHARLTEMKPMFASYPGMEEEVHKDFSHLDSICADQQVLEAMIENYRTKLTILETLLEDLKRKNHEHENKHI
jgi:RNA polymerase sigma factor (sigma-70 family)